MGSTNAENYKINDRVLSFYQGLFYEAKIIKVTDSGYRIHYPGWSTKYDHVVQRNEVQTKFKKFSKKAHVAAQKQVQKANEQLEEQRRKSKKKNENVKADCGSITPIALPIDSRVATATLLHKATPVVRVVELAMGSSNAENYKINDRVLSFYQGLFYEAKIIKVTDSGYRIHYQGWSKKYDHVVQRNEVQVKFKKFSKEAHVAAQKQVQKANEQLEEQRRKSKKKNENLKADCYIITPIALPFDNRGATVTLLNKATPVIRVDNIAPALKERVCELPIELQQLLLDDSFVSKNEKQYVLPCKYPVEAIVEEYCTHVNETLDNASVMQVDENVGDVNSTAIKFITSRRGLIDCFDVMFSLQLLYKFERLQYADHFGKPGVPSLKPSSVYGLPHLLRLLTKFDELMEYNPWDSHIMTKSVVKEVKKFMKFLVQEKDKFFNFSRDTTLVPLEI